MLLCCLVAKSYPTLCNSITPLSVAHQAPLSLGFPRQEYWNELPFPSPEDLPKPGVELRSPELQVDSSPSEPPGKPTCCKQIKCHSSCLQEYLNYG